MVVTEHTKISELIKANPAVIDVLSGINHHFQKLKNPILRKLLAPRVNIEEAAKIGGTSVETILSLLTNLGFEINYNSRSGEEILSSENINDYSGELDPNREIIKTIDAGKYLKNNVDPFETIYKTINDAPVNKEIKVICPFKPVPLIKILDKKGFSVSIYGNENSGYSVYIKNTGNKKNTEAKSIFQDEETFMKKWNVYNNSIPVLDVRHLEMPQPMITILKAINDNPEQNVFRILHIKVPHFLLPELNLIDIEYEICKSKDGLFRVLLTRNVSK